MVLKDITQKEFEVLDTVIHNLLTPSHTRPLSLTRHFKWEYSPKTNEVCMVQLSSNKRIRSIEDVDFFYSGHVKNFYKMAEKLIKTYRAYGHKPE